MEKEEGGEEIEIEEKQKENVNHLDLNLGVFLSEVRCPKLQSQKHESIQTIESR